MSGNGFSFRGSAKAKSHIGKMLCHFFEPKGFDMYEIQQLEIQHNREKDRFNIWEVWPRENTCILWDMETREALDLCTHQHHNMKRDRLLLLLAEP